MKHDIETQFEYAKEHLTLSTAEKDIHRAALVDFMRETRMKQKPVISPFNSLFFAMRYAFVALLALGVSGTGIAFAAEKSLPNDPLYIVKVRVSEPVQVAFTFDPKEKADLEVELVNRRLKEIAEASVHGTINSGALALASDSLNDNINQVQENIATLQSTQDTDTAFETAADLSATLATHAKILKKVQAADPSADIQVIAATVETESDQTDVLVEATTDAVENSTPTSLNASTDDQQNDTQDSLAKVKADIADALSSFDMSDKSSVDSSLAIINEIIAAAQKKDDAGDTKAAYLLYNQAEQKITELKTTIEADQELGIDVIDATSTEP